MATQKLAAVISVGAKVGSSVKSSFGVIDKRLKSVSSEIATMSKRQKEIDKQRTIWVKEGRAVEALDKEYQELGRTMAKMSAQRDKLKNIQTGVGRVGTALAGAGKTIAWQAGLATAAVTGLNVAMGALSAKVVSNIEESTRWANRIGVTPEFFSRLVYAVRPFGVEVDDLADGLKELTLRGDEFALTGKGSAAEAFERIGLSKSQVKALSQSPAALWTEVQSRLSEINNAGARQRIADELFGGTAAERMIEYLKLTREQIAALDAEAENSGSVITQEMADDARRFTIEQKRMIGVMEGAVRTIAVELMPVITQQFQAASAWIIKNRPQIQDFAKRLGETADRIGPVVGEVLTGLSTVMVTVGKVVSKMAELAGGWENLGIAAGVLFVAPTVIAIGKVVVSVVRLVATIGRIGSTMVAVATTVAGSRAVGAIITSIGTLTSKIGLLLASIRRIGPAFSSAARMSARGIRGLAANAGRIAAIGGPVAAAAMVALTPTTANTREDGSTESEWLDGMSPEGLADAWAGDPSIGGGDIQARARGGSYGPGALLVGERGPELRFENRSGFIATNTQLKSIIGKIADISNALRSDIASQPIWQNTDTSHATSAQSQGSSQVRNITIGDIHITAAPGMDVRQLADEVLRRIQSQLSGPLYGGATL